MASKFGIGDHVSWNSEAGRVSGVIVRVHTRNFDVNGYTHHASAEAPQYEIESSKTEHVAFDLSPKFPPVLGRVLGLVDPRPNAGPLEGRVFRL